MAKSNYKDADNLHTSPLLNILVFPMVLNASLQLDLFELMAKHDHGSGLTAKEIAENLKTSNPEAPSMLDRMLCLLTSYDVVRCSSLGHDRVYSLGPLAKECFVKNELGVSMTPLLMMFHDKVFVESWFHLKDAVLEGGVPFDRAHGVHAFEYPGKDPRFNQLFNEAMHNNTTIFMSKMLEGYKRFITINKLVDVGGGYGVSLGMIIAKYPHIKGVNFDLPHVIQHAPSYPGVEHVCGDMFDSVPSGDAILMKLILHDWSDAHCFKLLKNCHNALPENGIVIVIDCILPDIPDTSDASKTIGQMDLHMMTQNPGGKERRSHEFLSLAKEAGFSGIRHVCCYSLVWVMEFFK